METMAHLYLTDKPRSLKCKILSSRNQQSIGCIEYFTKGLSLVGYAINKNHTKVAEAFSFNEIFMSQKLGIIVTTTNLSGIFTDKFNAVVVYVFDKNSKYKVGNFIPKVNKEGFVYMTQKELSIIKDIKNV